MEKLSMCRICLGEDIRLVPIVGTHLQEMYESLVLMPFETEDGRPILACYICRARLKNCYKLRKSCLRSEELFTQMLSCNESKKVQPQAINNKKRLTMHNVIHFSVGHELGMDADNVVVEALKCEVKVEPNDDEDIDEYVLEENHVSDNIKFEALHDDFLIIVKEKQIGYRTRDSITTTKELTQDVQKSFEDSTSRNLIEHELVQDTLKKLHEVTTAEITYTKYTCDTCQQYYSTKCELESHIRLCSDVWKKNSTSAHTHTAKNMHHCNVCQKYFARKWNLRTHMRTHTGEQLYQCNICGKQFSQRGHLSGHIMSTHTDEKLYPCDKCEKQFSKKSNLTRHMRTHTGEKSHKCYKCRLCKKRFSEKWDLIKHGRTHSGEKPYHCDMCKKQFSQKPSLTRHMLIHTGEKLYQCAVCKKKFTRNFTLTTHMRSKHTGEKPHDYTIKV